MGKKLIINIELNETDTIAFLEKKHRFEMVAKTSLSNAAVIRLLLAEGGKNKR
jgi:hypothetical protein